MVKLHSTQYVVFKHAKRDMSSTDHVIDNQYLSSQIGAAMLDS